MSSTIKNIIFDFGDIFINLDKSAPEREFTKLGMDIPLPVVNALNESYEIGEIDTKTFLNQYQKWLPEVSKEDIISAWNAILKDFPWERMEFLKELKQRGDYHLFLLSNTNNLHIDSVKDTVPFFKEFKACFHKFYLSQEINLRKPNPEIYEYVLQKNNLNPAETLFVDDLKQNTDAAAQLGIQVWNLKVGEEEVTQLFEINSQFQ